MCRVGTFSAKNAEPTVGVLQSVPRRVQSKLGHTGLNPRVLLSIMLYCCIIVTS